MTVLSEPRCPSTEEWIQKMWYIYIMEYYSAIKNNEFMKFLGQWLDIVLPEDPAIQLLGIYPEDAPSCNKDTCSTMFIEALFIIARSWKEPRCPSREEWIQKILYIYIMEYYSAIKNNHFIKFLGKWIELENIFLSEVTQSQKNTYGMPSPISRY